MPTHDLHALFPETYLDSVAKNNLGSRDRCQFVRELLSNAQDACASDVILVPLLSDAPGKPVGLLCWDNGIGMSRPVRTTPEGKRVDGQVRLAVNLSS